MEKLYLFAWNVSLITHDTAHIKMLFNMFIDLPEIYIFICVNI